MLIYQRANKRGLSRGCRLSFAVCFSRRFKRFRGKASSSVDFSPFHLLYLKGLKTHRGTGKAGTIIYPSAEADGKREPAAQDAALSVCSPINHHLWFKSARKWTYSKLIYIWKKYKNPSKKADIYILLIIRLLPNILFLKKYYPCG